MIGLHMLHPLQGNAQQGNYIQPSASNQLVREGNSSSLISQPNIVRIPAKTALPIISSVPKCRSSKASRHHPIDTINGLTVSHSNGRAMQSNKNRGNNINQADQVLLIVNDDHIKGGGVPIIGRRLPSKSMTVMRSGSYGQEIVQNDREFEQLNAIDYPMSSQLQAIQRDSSLQIQQTPPVVGRRSHRLIQQQQQQQLQRAATVYHQQAILGEKIVRQNSTTEKKKAGNKYENHQQPLSIVETHLATSQQVHLLSTPYVDQQQQPNHLNSSSRGVSKSEQKLNPVKYQSISIMDIAEPISEYTLPPMQQVGRAQNYNFLANSNDHHEPMSYALKRSGRGQSVTKQIATRKGGANPLAIAPSSSCSSLCSTIANLNDSDGLSKQINYGPRCCPPITCSSNSDRNNVLDKPCRESCYQLGEVCENECDEIGCRDPSCNILAQVPNCCIAMPPSPVRKQIKQHQVTGKTCNKLYNHHHHHHHHNNGSHQGRQARATNNHHHHHYHHHSCQAKRLSPKPSASYRSSSLHDSRRQLKQQKQCQQSPMLISGRNILPVHPKPNLNLPSLLLNQQHCNTHSKIVEGTPTSIEDNTNNAVNQMYESLAAELKAKLGDPKMGPILLPPKDYDTMSRKQGKLTGIELRRSTNPQLVGPTAARINATLNKLHNNRENSINEDHAIIDGSVSGSVTTCSPTGSDRSSGRSQDDRSLQRSRSISSSGLGSISMGPSSPNYSPPISSNEDMCQTNTQKASNKMFTNKKINDCHHHHHDLSVDRKNSSPDNCNNSDSGHSGSGRLDSAMSSEERKVSSRDSTRDYLKSTPNNNNNLPTRSDSGTGGADSEIRGAKPLRTKQNYRLPIKSEANEKSNSKGASNSTIQDQEINRDKVVHSLNPTKVSDSSLWNGRVEVPLKVNSGKNGNTYLATKQIIY